MRLFFIRVFFGAGINGFHGEISWCLECVLLLNYNGGENMWVFTVIGVLFVLDLVVTKVCNALKNRRFAGFVKENLYRTIVPMLVWISFYYLAWIMLWAVGSFGVRISDLAGRLLSFFFAYFLSVCMSIFSYRYGKRMHETKKMLEQVRHPQFEKLYLSNIKQYLCTGTILGSILGCWICTFLNTEFLLNKDQLWVFTVFMLVFWLLGAIHNLMIFTERAVKPLTLVMGI